MSAYPKPDVHGTPFASAEWKGYVAYLSDHAKGDKPVRLELKESH